jgi:hypothetical protein
MTMIIIGIVLLGVGVLLLYGRRRAQDALLEIKATKTTTAKELGELQQSIAAEIGPGGLAQITELKGDARCDSPLTSQLAGETCVWYRMTVQERYEEHYTETDSQGRTQQKTRTGTTTVSDNTQAVPFLLDDGTGSVKIEPAGASLEGRQVVDRYEPYQTGGMGFQMGSFSFSFGMPSSGRRILGYQFQEHVIPVGAHLYVLGEAVDKDGVLRIQKPQEKGKPYIISTKSEEEITRGKESSILWFLIGSLVSFAAGVGLIVAGALGK